MSQGSDEGQRQHVVRSCGCHRNEHDSERIADLLKRATWLPRRCSPRRLLRPAHFIEVHDGVLAGAADPRARRFLAELGRRWHVIIDTVVPVDRPCTVKLSEQRPWRDAPSPYLRQEIEVGDATTTHVEIRASDHGIVLDRLRVDDFAGERVDVKFSDDARETADAIALYADASTSPGIVRVGLRARLRRGYWRPIWWLQLLITMAGATMLWLPGTFAHLVESLALLTFPLTLAGVVVLTRESTSLAERLLRRSRTLLMASIAALWAVALGRLLLHAEVGWAESAWAWVRDTISWMG